MPYWRNASPNSKTSYQETDKHSGKKVESAYHLSLFRINFLTIRRLMSDKRGLGLSLLVTFFGVFSFIFDDLGF